MDLERNENTPFFYADHITICYKGEPVVQDVSFELEQGEILGIVGESGSGKSTLVRAITGLLGNSGEVTGGGFWYKGENLTRMSEKKLRRYRGPEIGTVFQDSGAAFCPVRTVGAQLYEMLSGHQKLTKAEAFSRAGALMQKIGLTDYERVLKSYPFQLSGGMNQRVGICAAMLPEPKLLLADEPTSALDVTVQKQVVEELLLMRREFQTAIIVVTHNIGIVRKMADQVLVLKDGKKMDYGRTEEVLAKPESDYTRELLDSVIRLEDRRQDSCQRV